MASLREGAVQPYLHPGAAAAIQADEQVIGSIGNSTRTWRRASRSASLALLELTSSGSLARRAARSLPQSARRRSGDLAVVAARERGRRRCWRIAKTAGGPAPVDFDRYQRRGARGRVSLAFRRLPAADRRHDAEVTSAVERVVRMLSHRFGGNLR
jgi:phenylalanyl-tRNA synthetase beta subunit